VVVASLSIGAVVGVLLSGGLVYYEVGRFATPQVEETRFNERRAIFAYTGGLFVGVPLAIFLLLFLTATGNGAWPGALLFMALLLATGEAPSGDSCGAGISVPVRPVRSMPSPSGPASRRSSCSRSWPRCSRRRC